MSEIEQIRQWRDENRPTLGPDAAGTPALAGAWRKVDVLLTELDRVQPAIAQMWQDHQCQRPDLEAIVRDLATHGPPNEEYACTLCEAPGAFELLRTEGHSDFCPWRRAVEWVRDTDQETT